MAVEKLLGYIFSQPILAAAIIGSLIHFGKWINYTIHGKNYFHDLSMQLSDNTALAVVDILMSYIVPALVVTVSRKLALSKEQEFYQSFPDLNPDIIIKCASDGSPEYLNLTAQTLMHDLQISLNDIALLIPEELLLMIKNQNIPPPRIMHKIKNRTIEYSIGLSDDGLVFLSGRQLIES